MSGMSHGWIGARALQLKRRSKRFAAHGPGGGGGGRSNPGSPPTSPLSPSTHRRDGYEPLESPADIQIQITGPEEDEEETKKKQEEEGRLKRAVEEILEETNRLDQHFLPETASLVQRPSPCVGRRFPLDPSYSARTTSEGYDITFCAKHGRSEFRPKPGESAGGGGEEEEEARPREEERGEDPSPSRRSSDSDPGLSVSRRASLELPVTPRRTSRRKRSGYLYLSPYDPKAVDEWRQLQDDLMVFSKMREISLHAEWLSDNYGIGSYRYIHYTAYTKENQGKILDGTIESIFTTTCCCCCVGCSPVAVRIFIKDANNDDVMTIKLTGNVTKFPLDTAQLQTPSGKTFAFVTWRDRAFLMQNTDGQTMFRLRLKRWWPCNLQRKHTILSGDGAHTIGWITAKNCILSPEWSAGKILTTSVPRSLDVRQKAAWVSLLFLMKLYNKGKEYAKVQLHDS